MTTALLLMAGAGFCMGGAIALRRQHRPLWLTVALVLVALGLLYVGAATVRGS
ncbi:MAG: hypothetical protein H0V48_01300 [Nocardioidaceae bacterium]|nr:hypothetical protein [Nocardioidaceae bacterium]MDQ3164743.1 hypothetical protein [Actinomycetota bacterium]